MSQFSDLLTNLLSQRERMTRRELAKKVGFEPPRISDLLNGKTRASDEVVDKFAIALQLDDRDRQALLEAARADREKSVERNINPYLELPADELTSWFGNAERRIWIQESWITNPYNYTASLIKSLETAKSSGIASPSIRVVLLNPNPDSPGVRLRANQLSQRHLNPSNKNISRPEGAHMSTRRGDTEELRGLIEYVSTNVTASLKGFETLRILIEKLELGSLEIRLSDILPDYPLYIVDNRALIGYFPYGQQSDKSIHIEFPLDAELKYGDQISSLGAYFYVERFETFWNAAKEVSATSSSDPTKRDV